MEGIMMVFFAMMTIVLLLTLSMTLAALLSTIIVLVVPLVILLTIAVLFLRFKYSSKKNDSEISIGFFHPYCTAGGGGERVLWCAIKSIQKEYKNQVKCYVYTGDKETDEEIFNKVLKTFDIELDKSNCKFIRLTKRKWVEAERYPRFTLIGQSLGSMVLGWEALTKFVPTIFLDTMGYAFTFPLFSLIANSTVSCYVHYPTISSDMIESVESASSTFNNDKSISSNKFKTYSKLIYYKLFSKIYYLVGSFSKLVMVNGTWTGNHIKDIWNKEFGKDLFIVYPPVDVENRKEIPLNWMDSSKRKNYILSIAQFRPEKNHSLQLKTLAHLLEKYPIHKQEQLNTKLILVGGVRDQGDRDRVEELRNEARQLGIEDHVDFQISISSTLLNQFLSESSVGIHTMYNEHFGIGVVELMAAGVIPVANNSAGPKEDIVRHEDTGFLASSKEEYAEYIHEILAYREKYIEMQKKARDSTERFSESNFNTHFLNFIKPLININNKKNN